jgi:hypothetical protein
MRKSLILALVLVGGLSLARADIFVGPTAIGSGNCSSFANRCTYATGMASLPSASTGVIHVQGGPFTTGFDVTKGGTSPSQRLVLQCDAGLASATAAAGQCTITGTISFANIGIFVEANNVDVHGFDVGNNPAMGAGIIGANANTSIHIYGNYVHDLAQSVKNTAGTIVGCPENGAIGAGSVDEQAIGNFIQNFGINPAPSGCNVSQGIYFLSGIIENNLVVKVPVGAIQVSTGCNNVISNNTLINSKNSIIIENGTGCLGNNTVANNYGAAYTNFIFVTSSSAKCTAGAPNLFSHNMNDGSGADFSSGPFSCDTVTPAIVHQAATAFFVNYQPDGSGDYHLKAGSSGIAGGASACVPGGVSPCTPSVDFAGVVRPTPQSVGAFEQTGGGGGASMQVTPPNPVFANTTVAQCTPDVVLTVRNNGTANMTITALFTITLSQIDFRKGPIGTCSLGQVLAPGQLCTTSADFCPATTGPKVATYNLFSSAPNSPVGIPLSGNALAPLPPAGLTITVQ